jgi:hypothetical protein
MKPSPQVRKKQGLPLKSVVLNQGQFFSLADIWQCLETVLVSEEDSVTGGGEGGEGRGG